MKKVLNIFWILFITASARTQIDPLLLKQKGADTTGLLLNMDAVYQRPFLQTSSSPVALGGYVEANWQHLGTDGISEGHQFQLRRMTLFFSSTLHKKLKFLSEVELEEGGKQLAIEFAAIDAEIHPFFSIRGGIVLNPIGAFNQNHDGPKWEFTDRPISATQLLPATWSNAGFGIYGKSQRARWAFGYEVYLTGGFDPSIIDNTFNKSYLPASKNNAERFESTASGLPLYTIKTGVGYNNVMELGLSYMGGTYNKHTVDGLPIDKKRRVHVLALDINTRIPGSGTYITGEWARIWLDVPSTYTQQYGTDQLGGFIDIVQPVLSRKIGLWNKATINAACRLEYVDWNRGTFNETNEPIGDEMWSIMPGLSLRPSAQNVLRINYRHLVTRDIHGNRKVKTGGFIIGISSYF